MLQLFAQAEESGILTYFLQSNSAGKLIILVLAVISAAAWTVMIGKALELKQLNLMNLRFQATLDQAPSLLELAQKKSFGDRMPYAILVGEATKAYFRAYGSGEGADRGNAVSHAENALQRAVADQSLAYEKRMVMLASIVTGAPFMGLLGTVWGVMDAFGSLALTSGGAQLQMLAPGVSGALLTTVAGLLVAIPSVFGYNFLLSITKRRVIELENFASRIADRIELEDTAIRKG